MTMILKQDYTIFYYYSNVCVFFCFGLCLYQLLPQQKNTGLLEKTTLRFFICPGVPMYSTLNSTSDNFGTPKFLPKALLTCEYAFFACAKQMPELHDYLRIFACLPHSIHIQVLFNNALQTCINISIYTYPLFLSPAIICCILNQLIHFLHLYNC